MTPSKKKERGRARKEKKAARAQCDAREITPAKCNHGGPTGAGAEFADLIRLSFLANLKKLKGTEEAMILCNTSKVTICQHAAALLSNEEGFKHFTSGLVKQGTDYLLCKDIKSAKVAAQSLIWMKRHHDVLMQKTKSVDLREVALEIADVIQDDSNRTVISFFSRLAPCACLDETKKDAKQCKKTGWCDNCDDSKELVSLMHCTGCQCAQYCSLGCQRAHWPKHKKDCKQLRACIQEDSS